MYQSLFKQVLLICLLSCIIGNNFQEKLQENKEASEIEKRDYSYYHPEVNFTPEQREEYESLLTLALDKAETPVERRDLYSSGIFDKAREAEFQKKNKEKFSRFSTSNDLSEVGFFNFTQNSSTYLLVQQFIMNNVHATQSKFVLYPYPFNYIRSEKGTLYKEDSTEGGVFTFDEDAIANENFDKIKNITDAKIGHSRAIYDIDIGILSVSYFLQGQEVDLFSESGKYCTYFGNIINKVTTCLTEKKAYLAFKENYPSRGAVVLINNTLLLNNTLFDEKGNLVFKLLIVPDYYAGLESAIKAHLTQKGIDIIKKFREKGGHIIASGKSGYLLEQWGILSSGTYDTSRTINGNWHHKALVNLTGCEKIMGNDPTEQPDYLKELICLNSLSNTFLGEIYPMKTIPSDFETYITMYAEEESLIEKTDEKETILPDNTTFPYIVVSKENEGVGRIILVNANPLSSMNYMNPVRNFILYSMTKNVLFDIYIKFYDEDDNELPIPGGEEGVQLVSTYKFYNLFDTVLTDVKLDFLVPNNVEFVSDTTNSNCQLMTDSTYSELSSQGLNASQYYRCADDQMDSISLFTKNIKIEILSSKVTQAGSNIPLIYTVIQYKDGNVPYTIHYGFYRVSAGLAAVVRGTLNPEPTARYPLKGKGNRFDNVLNIENKENTEAKHVKYVSVIPLISPVVDGSDQAYLETHVPLYDDYYRKHGYTYPWANTTSTRPYDFIDYVEIAGKNCVYIKDWDTPVKLVKIARKTVRESSECPENLYEPGDENEVPDDYADQTLATNCESLLKEIFYEDADKFYERATQRRSLFIDTTVPAGAKAQYTDLGNEIPDDLLDKNYGDRTKVDFGFSRVDTYFYDVKQYFQPEGLGPKYFISIDKYDQSSVPQSPGSWGSLSAETVVEGHYDNTKEQYQTLVPNQYSNVLRQYSDLTRIDPSTDEGLQLLKNLTNGETRLGHYLVPMKHENIKNVESIMHFVSDSDDGSTGHHETYTLLKLIKGHSLKTILKPAETRLGGKVVITLPEGTSFKTDPIGNDCITVSCDHMAFYDTKYNESIREITLVFKRGLNVNENYGKDTKIEIYLEGLTTEKDLTLKLEVYQMKFDFSAPNYESFKLVSTDSSVQASWISFFSLPCIYTNTYLKRSGGGETTYSLYEYEMLTPFSRIGTWHQELNYHATVWGGEAHHKTEPGLQSTSGGFSIISNIGTSMVPFAEYVTHGKSILIPGASTTSRLEWNDIWGRLWVQNVRSCFPDVPPEPSAYKNFMMQTTFELISAGKTQDRLLEWISDESVYVHIQLKFLSNYEKWFIPVTCKENAKPYMKQHEHDIRESIFIDYDVDADNKRILKPEYKVDEYDCGPKRDECLIGLGISSVYGQCYTNGGSYLSGQEITRDIFSEMESMMMCADTGNATEMDECALKSDALQLPLLRKRNESKEDNSPDKTWNFSPLIEKYYPENYITETKVDMWDLTHKDYFDDYYYKGYVHHLDNNLPAIEVGPGWNPAYFKPHNIFTWPIYKGMGYQIEYSRDLHIKKYPNGYGWWSDQLQNKDNTLLAGQSRINYISVGQNELLSESDWIDGKDIKNTHVPTYRMRNVYVCRYNRHRIRISPNQTRYAYPNNVYQNNVVPVESGIDEEYYEHYECDDDSYQYSPYNISKVDNRVYTGGIRDWLYFALNLRGGAKENVHILTLLEPYPNVEYEGNAKVQDGGTFTYWNPANGPNSFMLVNNNVNTVTAKRVDLTIVQRFYPMSIYTIKSPAYQLFTIEDENELLRQYTQTTYSNSYGFGDVAIEVYVGGTDGTSCKVNPGGMTYVKYSFLNNAGFDWKMKDGSVDFEPVGDQKTENPNGYLEESMVNIARPKNWYFLIIDMPEELKDYVTVTTSTHNGDVAPQFFDLTTINVVTIKDALCGEYYWVLRVSEDFPEELQGRMFEIPVRFNESCFNYLPGKNDPTHYHDYTLSIPPIKFGVPFQSGEYKGDVYYISGQASYINFTFYLYKDFDIEGFKPILDSELTKLAEAVADDENKFENLEAFWNDTPADEYALDNLTYEIEGIADANYKVVTVNAYKPYPLFPFNVAGKPPQQKIHLLAKSFATIVPSGNRVLLSNSRVDYNDGRKDIQIIGAYPNYIYTKVEGPFLWLTSTNAVVEWNSKQKAYVEIKTSTVNGDGLFNAGQEVIVKFTFSFRNGGSGDSYENNFHFNLSKTTFPIDYSSSHKSGIIDDTKNYTLNEDTYEDCNDLYISYGQPIFVGSRTTFTMYFKTKIKETETDTSNANSKSKKFTIITGASADICKKAGNCDPNSIHAATQFLGITNSLNFTYRKNKSKAWIIILVVIIVVAIIAGVLFYIFKCKAKNQSLPPEKSVELIKKPQPEFMNLLEY